MAASSGHGGKSRRLRDHVLNCKWKRKRELERAALSQAASDILPPAKSAPRPQMSSPTEDQVFKH